MCANVPTPGLLLGARVACGVFFLVVFAHLAAGMRDLQLSPGTQRHVQLFIVTSVQHVFFCKAVQGTGGAERDEGGRGSGPRSVMGMGGEG